MGNRFVNMCDAYAYIIVQILNLNFERERERERERESLKKRNPREENRNVIKFLTKIYLVFCTSIFRSDTILFSFFLISL